MLPNHARKQKFKKKAARTYADGIAVGLGLPK
jgi:hypothetical protein